MNNPLKDPLKDSQKKILVTGAAGFIGARVVELLVEQGNQVTGVDNLSDFYDLQLKEHRITRLTKLPSFQFVNANIEDRPALASVFECNNFDAIINLAARAGVRASVKEPDAFMQTNAIGVLNVLEQMREHKVGKLVLASTSSLYAGQKTPFVESAAFDNPISPYAVSKKSAELMAHAYHSLHGIDVSVLRYFTVYGPMGRPDMSPFRFINWIQKGEPIQLFGDGSQQRDFTYIDDIARGTIAALKPIGYEVINLGYGKPYSMLDLIGQLEHITGRRAIIEHSAAHATDMPATWANIEKAERLLGWRAETDLAEGLKRTWKWHQEYFGFANHS